MQPNKNLSAIFDSVPPTKSATPATKKHEKAVFLCKNIIKIRKNIAKTSQKIKIGMCRPKDIPLLHK